MRRILRTVEDGNIRENAVETDLRNRDGYGVKSRGGERGKGW